jgi:hypothetical protein
MKKIDFDARGPKTPRAFDLQSIFATAPDLDLEVFLRHKEIYQSDERKGGGRNPAAAPSLIGLMSFRLVIPWRVALLQSSPPLHQPG